MWHRVTAILMLLFFPVLVSANSSVMIKQKSGAETMVYNQSVALLVYASKYKFPSWPPLENIPADIANVRAALAGQGFSVTVISDVTSAQITPKIQAFLSQNFGPLSRAVVYYSGHGYTDSSGQAFLIGSDVPPVADSASFNEHIVSISSLREVIKASKANHTLLVLDSCYSGALLQTKSPLPPPSAVLVGKLMQRAVWFIASGTATQRVAGDHSFAEIFVAALKGDAAKDPERRFLTTSELAFWVEQKVPSRSNQTPVSGRLVEPGGEMLFVPVVGEAVASAQTVTAAAVVAADTQIKLDVTKQFSGRYPGVEIFYYRKAADQLDIIRALNTAGIQYTAKPPQLSDRLKTNSIDCSPKTPIGAVKEVAYALMDKGIAIDVIQIYRFSKSKGKRIEILSTLDPKTMLPPTGPKLTRDHIASLTSCPQRLAGYSTN